jgi:hypothetical protein
MADEYPGNIKKDRLPEKVTEIATEFEVSIIRDF